MKKIIESFPKTTITAVLMAVLVYIQGKGYIGPEEANLISSVMVAFGLSVNLASGKFNHK